MPRVFWMYRHTSKELLNLSYPWAAIWECSLCAVQSAAVHYGMARDINMASLASLFEDDCGLLHLTSSSSQWIPSGQDKDGRRYTTWYQVNKRMGDRHRFSWQQQERSLQNTVPESTVLVPYSLVDWFCDLRVGINRLVWLLRKQQHIKVKADNEWTPDGDGNGFNY